MELNGTTSTPRVSRPRRFSRGRIVGAAVAALAVGATLAASGPAQGLNLNRIGAADAALDALDELQRRDEPVALLLADQRMPHMTGVEFLEQARDRVPDAKRVLLTAYADTEAAIRAINTVRLDYYLLKPWDPPEEHLYPVLDDML